MSENETVAPQQVNVVDTTQQPPAPAPEAPVEAAPEAPVEAAPKDPTEIKTIQQMAVEQGEKLPKQMSPEQLQMQLLLDHHLGMSAVVPAFKKLSQRGKDRLFTALMQLPHAGLETALNGDFEKQIYMAAQKAMMAKHAIIFNRAKREHDVEQKALAEKLKKEQDGSLETKPETKDEGVQNVGHESTGTANESNPQGSGQVAEGGISPQS